MKKLITLMLALAGMVCTVNAYTGHVLHLVSNLSSPEWDESDADNTYLFTYSDDGTQEIYEYIVTSSMLGSKDLYFRINFWDDWGGLMPNQSSDKEYTFSNGQNETFDTKSVYGVSDKKAFVIKHSAIKASSYKITVYRKLSEGAWIKAEIIDMPVTIADTYATFSCGRALDFSGSGIEAYVAESKESGSVTMTPVTKVPANTGLFLKGTTANVPVIATADATAVSTNYLHPTDGTTDIYNTTNPCYVLANQGGVGFFKVASSFTPDAGKAYLQLADPATGTSRLNIVFDEATSIETVAAQQTSDEYYNLQGQRIAQPTKGLYIVNGKKVIKK